MVEELLAEVDQRLRVGKGSGCSPPCVTRWSGGAVVHDRGALLRRGLRRRTTTHHVVELGSQHYRGQFNVVPGTVFLDAGRRLLVRPEHGGRRRAVDALDGHRFFVVVVVQLLLRGDGSVAPRGDAALLAPPLRCAPALPYFLYRRNCAKTLASVL